MRTSLQPVTPSRIGLKSILEAYQHFGVPYVTTEARGGWISTHCPYCVGSADFHLGFSLERKLYMCWRCGRHGIVETLEKLCSISHEDALDVYRAVKFDTGAPRKTIDEAQVRVNLSRYRRPSDVGPMRHSQRRYLEERDFDPDRIAGEWGVLGTGPTSFLDDIDYRFRLLIPIIWDGAEVSFQTRDVTGRSNRKYLACPADREVKSHKEILYGRMESWGDVGIVVEGVTDVWRLGPKACATFGIKFTVEQVREIGRRWRNGRVAIVFDSESQAQRQAMLLASRLSGYMAVDPVVVGLGEGVDPGSMSQDDADHLVRELTK